MNTSLYKIGEDDYKIAMEYSAEHLIFYTDELDELIRLLKIANESNIECNNLDNSLQCSLYLFIFYSLTKKENINAINYLNIAFDIFKITKSSECINIMEKLLNIYIMNINDSNKLEYIIIFDAIIDNYNSFERYIDSNRKNELDIKKICCLIKFIINNIHIFYYETKLEDLNHKKTFLMIKSIEYYNLINKIK
jgi:hypothetical protein